MKVVIDTNVLVSAALKNREPETVILFIVARTDFEWIVSPEILAEYKDVLSRKKFGLPKEVQRRWFDVLDRLTTVIEVDVAIDFPRDQKDAKFLACALTANIAFSLGMPAGLGSDRPSPLPSTSMIRVNHDGI